LLVAWRLKYSNTLDDSELEVSLWRGHPPFPGVQFWERQSSIAATTFHADLAPSGEPAWTTKSSSSPKTLESQAAAEYILNWWLEKALKHRAQP
jgi:hypothetical protein